LGDRAVAAHKQERRGDRGNPPQNWRDSKASTFKKTLDCPF
jgi:hypothetical protein